MKNLYLLRESKFFVFLTLLFFLQACFESEPPKPRVIVKKPELLNPRTAELILTGIRYATGHGGKVDDSIHLFQLSEVEKLYKETGSGRIWSDEKLWLPIADSLVDFINGSERYGLFPFDYHYKFIHSLREKLKDSASKLDAALWTRAELLMSDAFVLLARHLKIGRLERDSITMRTDSILPASFYMDLISEIKNGRSLRNMLESVEPQYPGYLAIREALPQFLDSMDRSPYTYIEFPYEDSLKFLKQLQSRLFESSYITFNTRSADSVEMAEAVKKAQADRGLKVDGKAGPEMVRSLNDFDRERFIRIAINLDRYKLQLPDSMPETYIWVNLPAFRLQIFDSGYAFMESKIIIGQPKTRTPVLTSYVTNFITYPQWTVPFSIIFKEMLPQIQKNIEYLDKQNLMVVDRNDSVIDPATIDWKKLSKKYFPYNLRQRQGDDNSLGVMKFNFRNKYAVYLHDTNARGLFSRSNRALSHGCVRVKEWNKIALYLVRNDSLRLPPDTLSGWLKRQEKHVVSLTDRVPIFIRYFTVEAREGRLVFYNDIYSDDKYLRERYFYDEY